MQTMKINSVYPGRLDASNRYFRQNDSEFSKFLSGSNDLNLKNSESG